MAEDQTLTLCQLRWERTNCYIELAATTPFLPADELWLEPLSDVPTPRSDGNSAFQLTGVYVESAHIRRFRPLIGDKNKPIAPGHYQLVVRRDGQRLPLKLPDALKLEDAQPTQTNATGTLTYLHIAHAYRVIPYQRSGFLAFDIEAKGFPSDFSFHPRKRLKAAKKALKRAREERLVMAFYNFCRRHCKLQDNKILFTSDNREELGGNLEALYRRMDQRGLCTKFHPVFSFEPRAQGRSLRNRLHLAYQLATAHYIFCDDHQPFLYQIRYRKGVHLVQLWHACGHFKTIGHGRIGTLEVQNPFSRNHASYTDVSVASKQDIPIYAEAFGIPDERVHAWGIPRHDELLDAAWQERKRQAVQKQFPALAGKKLVVFAPTFRGQGKGRAYYDFDQLNIPALAQCCREHHLFVIFKMHPLVTDALHIPSECLDVCADGSQIREVNDLLPSADVVISDYSSVVYEAALLSIPTLYFAYDLERYEATRSFYQPYEEFVSGKIVTTFDELLQALAEEDFEPERLESFRTRNFAHLEGGACDRIIDALL